MTIRKGLRKALETIAALPDDDWQPADWSAFFVSRSAVRSELSIEDRREARSAAAKAARDARPKAGPTPQQKRRNDGERRWQEARDRVLFEYPWCQAHPILHEGSDRPRATATEVHHMAGRSGKNLWEGPFLACCSGCHRWITENPHGAFRLGLSLKRLGVGG